MDINKILQKIRIIFEKIEISKPLEVVRNKIPFV